MHHFRIAVLVVVAIVALSDLAVGFFLLASHEPWRADGPGTLWTESAALASIPAVASLYRRLGGERRKC